MKETKQETKQEGKNRRQREYTTRNKDKVRARERYLDKERRRKDPRKTMVDNARKRARDKGFPFDITFEDVIIPDVCPVLGIPLMVAIGTPTASSPSLDKFIPSKGYVKGNIHVISHKANQMKSNASLQEVELLLQWMQDIELG